MRKAKNAAQVFALVWKIDPAYFFLLVFNSLAYSGQVLINVILPKQLIDELTGALRPKQLMIWVAAIVAGNLLFAFLTRTAKRLLDVKKGELRWLIERAFAEKIMSVEYRHLEDPHFLDIKERASFAMRNQSAVDNLISGAITFVSQLVTALGLVAVMVTLSWVLVAVLLVTVGIIIAIQAAFAKYQQAFFADLLPLNRRYGYYVGLGYGKDVQKDARVYGMTPMLAATTTRYNREITAWLYRLYRILGLSFGLFQVVVVLQTAIAYGYVGARTLTGSLGIGDLTMYVAAAIGFSSAVIALGEAIVTVSQMLSYLDPFAELMSISNESEAGGIPLDEIGSICFDHVVFSYPKTDKRVLDDISFTINAGEKISIVGLNGAGKTTVVKLLCRLYRPDSGRILINGVDIFEYDRRSYLSRMAAVFQDFRLFDFTVQENITCRPAGEDDERVNKILDDVGMSEKIASLPHGIRSLFGREYDEEGVEFSGGQSQKIAIARALYKDASLIVLDEPTSALDPISEAEIYENFNSLVGERTAIYISHRMSSSVFCDRILVLNDGRIEAFDTHKALMQDTDGLYCRLFTSQAEHYKMS